MSEDEFVDYLKEKGLSTIDSSKLIGTLTDFTRSINAANRILTIIQVA